MILDSPCSSDQSVVNQLLREMARAPGCRPLLKAWRISECS